MKLFLKFILILLPFIAMSQSNSEIYKITYEQFNNGKKTAATVSIFYHDGIASLSKTNDKIQQYIDYLNNQNVNTIVYNDQLYKNQIPFTELPQPKFEDKPEEILGYNCKYASFFYFSNKIEVWYTEEAQAKGVPYSRYIPTNKALALKVLINGNRELKASSIDVIEQHNKPSFLTTEAINLNKAEFEEVKINSRFKTVQVFDDERINFDPSLPIPEKEELIIDETYRFSKGSVIMKKIKLTEELRNSGYIHAKLNCRSDGDAYDRTGSVFIVPASAELSVIDAYCNGLKVLPVYTDNDGKNYQGIVKEGAYIPPIEIMRFFTSFGASHFNKLREINNYDWAEDVIFEQEISELIPNDEDEIWIGVFIGNYDKGGHKVSLELGFYPGFETINPSKKKFIEPLFSTVNTMEMSGQNYGRLFGNDTLKAEFELSDGIENLKLLFTTTGHGGWGGGDEFNPKLNQVLIDGKEVFRITPWRTDCATYRELNPASGNFENGLSSSDLSRSNWCPATLTPPFLIPLNNLKSGKHTIEVIIDQGEKAGNSFSHWSVTGVLTGLIEIK